MIAIAAAGCGSEDGTLEGASLESDTAERLAMGSEEIAEALDAGDTCDAAHRADQLASEVSEVELPDELRGEAEAGAEQLVNSVNCEPEPEGKGKGKRDKEEAKEDEEQKEGEEDDSGSGASGQGDGSLPPGQEKKVEDGGWARN